MPVLFRLRGVVYPGPKLLLYSGEGCHQFCFDIGASPFATGVNPCKDLQGSLLRNF